MAMLHEDADMAAQLQRILIGAYADSADLGEAMATGGRIAPGDYAQWYEEWGHTARVASAAADDAAARGHHQFAARGYLRSAEYWRQAYFFLRHDLADDRIRSGYERQLDAFRKAMPYFPFHVEAVSIPFSPVPMPGYMFRSTHGGNSPPANRAVHRWFRRHRGRTPQVRHADRC